MRYNEHRHAFHNNSHSSKFAQHLNEHVHSFGTINNIMQILQYQKKGPHLNTIECFYIHIEAASDNHLNDSHTIFPNRIFDTILKTLPSINHPLPPLSTHHIPLSINTPQFIMQYDIHTRKPVFYKGSTHTHHCSPLTYMI
jgi:hypothetical protein